MFDIPFPCIYVYDIFDSKVVFGALSMFMGEPSSAADDAFAEVLQQNVMHFVKTGKPLDPKWQVYPTHTALIAANISYVSIYHKEQRKFWMNNGFFPYSWIN